MAQRYYGLNRGETQTAVTEGSSTTAGLDVEVRVDLAGISAGGDGLSEVLTMLENIKQYIITKSKWPPA